MRDSATSQHPQYSMSCTLSQLRGFKRNESRFEWLIILNRQKKTALVFDNFQQLKMSIDLVLKLAIVLFLKDVMYTTALQPCNSTTDCDNGYICCTITKICVSKCKGECCNSSNTCTETNGWKTAAIVMISLFAPFCFGIFLYFVYAFLSYLCKDGSSNSSSKHAAGVGGEGGNCGDGGNDAGGCGIDGEQVAADRWT